MRFQNIDGVTVSVSHALERGKGVILKNTAYLCRYDASKLVLETNTDYGVVFSWLGVNDDTLDACFEEAMKRVLTD